MSSLKQQTISGMIWSGVQRFGTMGISFISNMVLARLLTPDDFGCIGMLAIFIALSNTFIDGGFGSALIQKKEPTQEDYSTIFYWNIILGVILYLILYLSSPYIASFYDIPLLEDVLKVQGVVLIINSFSIIQTNQLRKKLLFKKLAIVNIIATTCSIILAIVMAYKGKGVWSLVGQQLSASIITAILLWIIGKWTPAMCFSFNSFKSLFKFGSFIFLSSFINTLFNNINGLIIGKLFSSATMGYFSQAKKVEECSAVSIRGVVEQVTYPVLVEFQNDQIAMKSALKRFNCLLLYIVTPLMLIISLLSDSIIVFLFSEKWLPASKYLHILAIQGIAIGWEGVNYNAVAAVGKSRALFNATIIKRFISLGLMIMGVWVGGIIGLLWGMTLASYVIVLYNMVLVRKFINYTLISQIKPVLPIFLISTISYLLVRYVVFIDHQIEIIEILTNGIIFTCIYIVLSLVFKIDSLNMLFSQLRTR